MCAERREWGCESDRFSTQATTVGGLRGRCVACVTLARSQSRGTGSGRGSWEDTSPPLFVCIKPLSDTSFKWPAEHKPLWLGGICHFCILIIQPPLTETTGHTSTSLLRLLIRAVSEYSVGLQSGISVEVKHKPLGCKERRKKKEQWLTQN